MKVFLWALLLTSTLASGSTLTARNVSSTALSTCPGYKASNIRTSDTGLTANLTLAGPACNVFGTDLTSLSLTVTYQSDDRLHVLIQDFDNSVYQVPNSVFPRVGGTSSSSTSKLAFTYEESPFSFQVKRATTDEILFDSSAAPLVFENQYLRLRTKLPEDPNLYGLGEHSDSFRLRTSDYTRTLWSADAYAVPENTNLYGNHPVYYEHRETGSHGVFLLNSNGMDIKINRTATDGQYLEYNTLGGVIDLTFLAGESPVDVARQYAQVAGLPAMMPYWGFGFQQCRYGYQDAFEVAEVVHNYSQAGIPLETMWTDIDYMDRRRGFSLDPDRFSLKMMRQLVDYLHSKDQHYVLMVNPGIAYQEYPPFQRGVSDDVFMKASSGDIYKGVVWPGVTAYPDWFKPNAQDYWNNEFATFFSPETGVDIDALWIDMNEPSNFPCHFPCDDPERSAIGYPPAPPTIRAPPRALPGFPCEYQPKGTDCKRDDESKSTFEDVLDNIIPVKPRSGLSPKGQAAGQKLGLPGRDLLFPKYAINNKQAFTTEDNAGGGGISNHTVNTDVIHYNGLAEYDVHNVFGAMMSSASRDAMLLRRPDKRPMVITRSTFAGLGSSVGHWLGDNLSNWSQYRLAIRSMMAFTSIYQMPMTGADVCGYGDSTTEQLCARWAMLGAFAPFYRNHNAFPPSISQEFFIWPTVTKAAKKAIDVRYKLMDYIYTASYTQSKDGTPLINPMFYSFPSDSNSYSLENQYLYGPGLLVAPVLFEGSTSVSVYFPAEIYYSVWTYKTISSKAQTLEIADQAWTDIPLFFQGGTIFPMRVDSAMTTKALRLLDFDIVVAPDLVGNASGQLYLDDGESLVQEAVTLVELLYQGKEFSMRGLSVDGSATYAYKTSAKVATVTILGWKTKPASCMINGVAGKMTYDAEKEAAVVQVDKAFTANFSVHCS